MSKRRAAAKRGVATKQAQRELAEVAARKQAIHTRNKATGRRLPAVHEQSCTGKAGCKCRTCATSMHPDKVSARREEHRKKTVLRQPLPKPRKKQPGRMPSPVPEFHTLAKGQKVWLAGTKDWDRELAIVLKTPKTDDDIVTVEVQRSKQSGWIITRPGYALLEVKANQIEGYRPLVPQRTVGIKGKRAQEAARRDLTVYQVYRDSNGIAYLRVNLTQKGAQFVVNKGFSVELIELDANSTFAHMLAMRPVVGADIQECAKRLLHPLNENVTISTRAKQELESIINNKELEMKATQNVPAARPAKFAQVTAPAARGTGRQAATSAKAARTTRTAAPAAPARAQKQAASKRAPAAANNGNGAVRASNDDLIVHAKVKTNPLREGTFCAAQVDAIIKANGKTVAQAQQLLDKSGVNPNGRRLEVSWLTKKGYATFK